MSRPERQCPYCKKMFVPRAARSIYCCRSCSAKGSAPEKREACREGGKNSAHAQRFSRRSKNEVAFAERCKAVFKSVECNEQRFNGWDADVIIHDLKIAVLWNGKWHYEQIGKHSLLQVQTRDRIKMKEIVACGYTPHVIKDLGKYNEGLVEEEFNKFMNLVRDGEAWSISPGS